MVKLFTHTDLDGVGCAILAKLAFGNEVDIEYCDYDNINENVMNYLNHDDDSLSYIYITDIRVNEEVAELLDKRGGVVLLDHHPTALGFGGIGGQAMTSAYTTVVMDMYSGWVGVFFDERLAYKINNPNQKFYEDMRGGQMVEVAKSGIYRRKEENE